MSLRLRSTNRKKFKTAKKKLSDSIPYLVWKKFPKKYKLDPDNAVGKQIWVAGTSQKDYWKVRKYHKEGSPKFPEGGITAFNERGEVIRIFYEEAILHPKPD